MPNNNGAHQDAVFCPLLPSLPCNNDYFFIRFSQREDAISFLHHTVYCTYCTGEKQERS